MQQPKLITQSNLNKHKPMKIALLSILAVLALAFTAHAADKDHLHDDIKAGPSGGRLITAVEPHAEFFVNKDNKVEIRFVDDDNKVLAPGEQVVTVTLGDRSAPTRLFFSKDGNKLVSDKTIPAGNDHPTVVQIKAKAGEKAVNEKFNLNLEQCPTCKNKEYACICDHDHGDEKKK